MGSHPSRLVRDRSEGTVLPLHSPRFPAGELSSIEITTVYLVVGLSALLLSDAIFPLYFADPILSQLQVAKGGIEVLLTAAFIFVVTRRQEVQHERDRRDIEEKRQKLQVLHRVLRHNLRNDINVIEGYTTLIRSKSDSGVIEAKCDKILTAVEDIANYTTQANLIRRVDTIDAGMQTVDLSDLLPRLLDENPSLTDDVDVSLQLPEKAIVEVNPLFSRAVDEVLTNALEHNTSEQPTLTVVVSDGEADANVITLRIKDNGPGIPPAEAEALQLGQENQLLHLSGMGLWFVKWTISNSGGELTIESDEDSGTTVAIQLPVAVQ